MAKTGKYSMPNRFYSLDILRGLAALAVVLFHWRHCFYSCTAHTDFVAVNQPFYTVLSFLYEFGQKAVELFFTLSGFIFFWLYSKKIDERKISFYDFSILRLSRLYPLHFVTLIAVIFLQYIYHSIFDCYFLYANNDLYHFILQLFFASGWGFQKGVSYNGPIWSVSIEILLYVIFFIICWFKKDKISILLIIAFGAYAVFYYRGYQLTQGAFSFFVGGLTYKLFRLKFDKIVHGLAGNALICSALLAWVITVLEVYRHFFERRFLVLLNLFSINQKYTFLFDRGVPFFVSALLFPLTIVALVILEVRKGSLGKRIAFIGDISYSSYLLHFPLQLVFVLSVNAAGYTHTVFESPVLLFIFFFVLIAISLASHRFFEIPVQKKLRRKLLANR
jgi:peptidoglycan/LPS O-acetylase OafA/YrhL